MADMALCDLKKHHTFSSKVSKDLYDHVSLEKKRKEKNI